MQEQLRTEIISGLAYYLTNEQLKTVSTVLTVILNSYEVAKRTTEIAVYDGGIPNEIKSFLVCKSLKGLTKKTLDQYERTLVHFYNNVNKDIKKVTTNDIRLYLLNYEKMHCVCKSYIDDKRRTLNSFFVWMLREELISKNPLIKIDAIKCKKKVREPLTDLEMEHMRNACASLRNKAILETLYSTGCRVSELAALNRNDIDYNTCQIKVFGKGKKERFTFINAKSQVAIKKYLLSRIDDNEALFVSSKKPNNRLGKGSIEKEISSIGIKANIRGAVFPHRIRHTTATHMLQHGASLADVQMLLGHESPATTQIYAKYDLQSLKAIHQKCII